MKVEKAKPAEGMPDDLENQPEMPPGAQEPQATSVEAATSSEAPASADPPAVGPISSGESVPTTIVSPC
ncbi:MAG: hypothetical protein WB780_21205 [Candidatus Acidiferrales bacterium]